MKIYANITFKGRYPVGTCCAVIVANDSKEASEVLTKKLRDINLIPNNEKIDEMSMIEIRDDVPNAVILCDGDY